MGAHPGSSPSETFIHQLRSALNHLYDPDYLRGCSLAGILGVSGRFDTPSALQGILTRAIEELKPSAGAPNKIHAQAIFDILLYRYVQQFNQNEIANQLGISVRHLRRQQNQAIYELADRLWEQYPLGSSEPAATMLTAEENPTAKSPAWSAPDRVSAELGWLSEPSSQVASDLSYALEAAHLLIQPFVEQNQAHLVFPMNTESLVQVHPVALQQVLLSLLTLAIQQARGAEITLETSQNQGWLTVAIQVNLPSPAGPADAGALESVQKMVELSQGRLAIEDTPLKFSALVSFRAVEPVNVLVIDDNAEIVTLLQRFAAETCYRIIGLNDPMLAIDRAIQIQPDLIVLDIMMPQVDGLQVLSRIKHHPILGKIPVIICSVLPQKNLAASLGAVDFIQKPIQREAFITALASATS